MPVSVQATSEAPAGLQGRLGAKKDIFTPVIQAGGTVAITRNLHVTGGMDLGFPRYKAHSPTDDSFSMRPSPVTFKLALGLAF